MTIAEPQEEPLLWARTRSPSSLRTRRSGSEIYYDYCDAAGRAVATGTHKISEFLKNSEIWLEKNNDYCGAAGSAVATGTLIKLALTATSK